MPHTETKVTRVEPSGVAKLVRVFNQPGQRLEFEDGYIHYIHPAALVGVTGLTVESLSSAQIHFLAPLTGYEDYESYRPDAGVVNFVNCSDLLVTGLRAENTKVFSGSTIFEQASCAVNVEQSTMRFENCDFVSNGKICLAIHSGSYVELDFVKLTGYYFELLVAASQVHVTNSIIIQSHPDPDSHSAIWVNSSMRNGVTNELFQNTTLNFDVVEFNMASGRNLVSGNGAYDTRSVIDFKNITLNRGADTFGICAFAENYNSITITTDGSLNTLDRVDFLSTPEEGFATYVSYYDPDTRPGKGLYEYGLEPAPIRVDGLNSDDIWASLIP